MEDQHVDKEDEVHPVRGRGEGKGGEGRRETEEKCVLNVGRIKNKNVNSKYRSCYLWPMYSVFTNATMYMDE